MNLKSDDVLKATRTEILQASYAKIAQELDSRGVNFDLDFSALVKGSDDQGIVKMYMILLAEMEKRGNALNS